MDEMTKMSVRILVVDDRQVNRELMRACLEPIGYEVTTCSSASEALTQARANTPDLMISDIHMSPTSGILLCRYCKNDAQLRQIPFLLFSASYPTEKEVQDACDSGADCCLNRPLDPQELIAHVQDNLRKCLLRGDNPIIATACAEPCRES